MKDKVIYILGAGCSAFEGGYPLAKDFLSALKNYRSVLLQRPGCERLKKCLADTADLMEKQHALTIDRLVLRIHEDIEHQRQNVFGGSIASGDVTTINRIEQEGQKQVLDAKIATVAMFLEREESARSTGLPRYCDLLSIMFDGDRNPAALGSSCTRVFSFNNDRLFEAAFSEYFGLTENSDIYGKAWLNSGFDFSSRRATEIDTDRFCLLKLHGTAAMRVVKRDGKIQYGTQSFHKSIPTMNDNFFWPSSEDPESLIVFPSEKDRAREKKTSFLCDEYVRAIWDEHASDLIKDAEQIWVIGYSFDPNDRKSVLDLLRRNAIKCDIVVQNPAAQVICNELGLRYRDLAPRLKPLSMPF